MSFAEIVMLVLKLSIILTVFVIGLNATFADATYLFRNPVKLLKGILSMNAVMLVVALLLVSLFNLHPAVKVALVVLALSPVPPFIPNKAIKAGGTESYTIGLLAATGVLSIALVPLTLELLQRIFDIALGMPTSSVAQVVLVSVLVPLLLGVALRTVAPAFATKIKKPLSLIALAMMVLSALPLIVGSWSAIWSLIGNGTVVALVAFGLIGLGVGHLLGGPLLPERIVLGICTAARHPAIAIGIAVTNFSHQKLATPAILLYLIVSSIVTIPYMQWVKRLEERANSNGSEGLRAAAGR